MKKDIYQESLQFHKKLKGKLEVRSKVKLRTAHDLSIFYTPGVAEASRIIAHDKEKVYDLTMKNNSVAVVSDGSSVLGLGNIGASAALPVMEGKAQLFKEFAGIDAFPICIETQNSQEIISIVKNIAPVFGGINLEDIAAPRCFEIEEALQNMGIPVFHDDQHGTAIVVLAALINAAKLAGKKLSELIIVINGAGAAGTAVAKMLLCIGQDKNICQPVRDIILCDSKGIISKNRPDIAKNIHKKYLTTFTNKNKKQGTLADAFIGADVFIGVSRGNLVTSEMVKTMNDKSIIFAMANPTPEIMPADALAAGAFIVATGRSDFPNQVNNVLAFPGIFRGALDARAKTITSAMKIGAAFALAESIQHPTRDKILPSPLDKSVVQKIASRVAKIAKQ